MRHAVSYPATLLSISMKQAVHCVDRKGNSGVLLKTITQRFYKMRYSVSTFECIAQMCSKRFSILFSVTAVVQSGVASKRFNSLKDTYFTSAALQL